MRTKSFSAALTAVLFLSGCVPENGTSNNEPQGAAVADGGSNGSAEKSLPGTDAGAAARTSATAKDHDTAGAISQDEKALLASIDARYFGVFTNSLPGENVDLNKLGFPDASSLVAAARSTDDELLRNAREGGHLERALYIDRVASLVPPENWKGVGDTAEDNALATRILDARSFALQNIGATRSPFAVYQAAALFNATEVGGNPEIVAASFQLAAELGDARAARMLQSYTSANRNMDARGVLAAYTFLKSALRSPGSS